MRGLIQSPNFRTSLHDDFRGWFHLKAKGPYMYQSKAPSSSFDLGLQLGRPHFPSKDVNKASEFITILRVAMVKWSQHQIHLARTCKCRLRHSTVVEIMRCGDCDYRIMVGNWRECVNINATLFSYSRAFGNEPRNFEAWSSYEDGT
ncbi:hypothetical protein TNCV_2842751 [Trichonephila clavipes]|nr:hypothetical protein TNCV_2842751 [Trichonephila clavipes]